jgi:hypothetical protein
VIDLSAEGTQDWFAPAGNTSGNYHSRAFGGEIMKSFDWITAGQNLFTQGSSFTVSSTASDDATGNALIAFSTDQGVYTTGSASGFGFRFRVPANSTGTRTLKIYSSVFSGAATLTAHLTDGSAADVADVVDDQGAGGYNFFVWTINYESAHDGQELQVVVNLSTNYGNSPNIKFMAATLQ